MARIDADGAWLWATSSDYFLDNASFGATPLTSAGVDDVFVARIDAGGQWAWAVRADGSMQAGALSATTAAYGGAIVTGYFTGMGSFGGIELTSTGGNDVFVARVDEAGAWTWANRAGVEVPGRPPC